MIKNKLDFKLINIAIVTFIVFLLYQMGHLWTGLLSKVFYIITPFFFAFAVAYALHPILRFLQSKKIPKGLGIFIIMAVMIGVIVLLISLIVPTLFEQLSSLFNGIITFLKEISLDYDLNLGSLQSALSNGFNEIIANIGKYISNGTMNIINVSLGYFSMVIIAFSASMYFLYDMDNLRAKFKKYLLRKSNRAYRYFSIVDHEMKNYLTGFLKIAVISVFEYFFAYAIIGHPNALLLGFLAAVAGLIPYFGGIINNIVAAITAFVISPALFIRTIIAFAVLSSLDGYVINPLVYGKTNKVPPLVVIFSVFAGGALFGVAGIILSLPVAIVIIATYKFFQDDINDKLEDFKVGKKKEKVTK